MMRFLVAHRLSLLVGILALNACRCGAKPSSGGGAGTPTPTAFTSDSGMGSLTCPQALSDARTGGTIPNSYVSPTDQERTSAGAAMTTLLGGTKPDVGGFGFEVLDVPEVPHAFLMRENPSKRRGGGAYLVRNGSSKLVIQAPHTFFDEGTFPLACELFQRSAARALFINTVHRYKGAAEVKGEHPADVAHSTSSLFQASTEALVKAVPNVTIVQLHGFASRGAARAVVSSGERKQNALVTKVANALQAVVGGKVHRFPDDTSELGATTNVQGQIVRRAGGRFIHIEMEEPLRKELLADDTLRARALDAIANAVASP